MADPLSIASGIAGLLSLTGTAFHIVHQYVREAKDAKDYVKALSKELQSLSSVLQGVKVLAEAFEQDRTTYTVLRLDHISACKDILNEILQQAQKSEDVMENGQSIRRRVESLKWPFRKNKTEDLMKELSSLKGTLSVALDAESLSALADCLSIARDSEKKLEKISEAIESLEILKRIQPDAERERVLDFFMRVDPSTNLQASWRLRHPGTGKWLTESLPFRTWLSDAGSKIWLSGIPGAGKTVLAGATIREALQQATTNPGIAVSFFFCDYKNQETWTTMNVLGTIATQLAWQNDGAYQKLKAYHERIRPATGMQLSPDPEEIGDVIIEEAREFKKVLLIVDGLDECSDNAVEVSKVLSELIEHVPNISAALFSRDELDIRNELQDAFDHIPIAAHSEDISLYVAAELDKRIDQRQLRIYDTKLKDEILLKLTSDAQGMFRWVACQLDALAECPTDADRRAALLELPRTLPETYERILNRINQKHPRIQRLVQISLQLIAVEDYSYRLPIDQLCQAVSVPEQSGQTLDEASIVKEEEILRGCSSFIRKSAGGQYFEFAHFSVREYLEDPSLLLQPHFKPFHISESSIHNHIACQCLRFLQMKNFDRRPYENLVEEELYIDQRDTEYPLYPFAATQWPTSAYRIQQENSQLSANILQLQKTLFHPEKSNQFLNWMIELYIHLGRDVDDDRPLAKKIETILNLDLSTLHVAAALNNFEVASWLVGQTTLDKLTASVGSPLDFAVKGVFAFFGLNEYRSLDGVAYHYMPLLRSPSLRDYLLSKGHTLAGSREGCGRGDHIMSTVLDLACRGETSPLKFVLENDKKLWTETLESTREFFKYASYKFSNDTLLDLIKHVNACALYKTTEGHEVCSLLWTAALTCPKFAIDTSLLPSDITLSYEALIGNAFEAVRWDDIERLEACKQDSRFNVHKAEQDGEYLLHIAVQYRSHQTLKLLLSYGCDVIQRDSLGRQAVHYILDEGLEFEPEDWIATTQLLLGAGASVTSTDLFSCTPLHHAARSPRFFERHEDTIGGIFQLFGASMQESLEMKNNDGMTPLDIAFSKANTQMVLMFLDHYPMYLGCCGGQTCVWDHAAKAGDTEIIETLVEMEFPRHPDDSDGRPFHSLSTNISLQGFKLLFDMYPKSFRCRREGKLAIESYLSRVTAQAITSELPTMQFEVIKEFLSLSPSLSPSSVNAINFCCHLVSNWTPAELPPRTRLLQLFLENGINTHHSSESLDTSILKTACLSFKRPMVCDCEISRALLMNILDHVDEKQLNQYNKYGHTILHAIGTSRDIDTDWLIPELVRRGANIDLCSKHCYAHTPMTASLDAGSSKAAQTLLKLGANPNLRVPGQFDAAQLAALRGAVDFLHDLLHHVTVSSQSFDWNRLSGLSCLWDNGRRNLWGLNSLHLASVNGYQDCFGFFTVNNLIDDVHSTSADGYTCLHFAAMSGGVEMINYLLDLGLDIDAPSSDGTTPLHAAVRGNQPSGVLRLLERKASIKRDIVGMTMLMYAERLGLDGIVRLIKQHAALSTDDVTSSPGSRSSRLKYLRKALEKAITNRDAQECSRLLKEGCPVDVSLPACGCSPLSRSIFRSSSSDFMLVRLFLHSSASVTRTSCFMHGGWRPIFQSLQHGYLNQFLPQMLESCLQEGLSYIIGNPLKLAVTLGNLDALHTIISHVRENLGEHARLLGCHPDDVMSRLINNYGEPMPFHAAIICNNLGAVKLLLQAGADIDGQNERKLTPLQLCRENIKMAKYLLSMGATPILSPSSSRLCYYGSSARAHKRIATQVSGLSLGKSIFHTMPVPLLHPKVLWSLVADGYDLNSKTEYDISIMHSAMRSTETAAWLLNQPLQLTQTDLFPWSSFRGPIEHASWMNRHWQQYRRRFGLEELRRISNLEPKRGWSPLCLATSTDALSVMEHCLQMGADVDFEGSPYGSALMAAAGMNRIDSVKFLVRHNAAISYEGKQGFTSALAVGVHSRRIIDWLLVGRFQEQAKLVDVPECRQGAESPQGACAAWSPVTVTMRLIGGYERCWSESSLAYLKRLGVIKRYMEGKVVQMPRPEVLAKLEFTATYDF